MNAKRPLSLYATLLLIGLIFVAFGAWGTWHFGSKFVAERELPDAASPSPEPQLQDTPQPQTSGAPPTPAPSSPNPTPALATSDSGSSSPLPTPAASGPGASWTLDDAQRKKLVDALRKHPSKSITICSVESDKKGFAFAGTLKRAFEEAGWRVDAVKQLSYATPPVGLNLAAGSFPYPEGPAAAYLALTSAGFHVSQELDSKLTGDQAVLIVGALQ